MSKATKDSLGDRMKTYEEVPKVRLVKRTPVIIRLDGKAFHTFTKRKVIKDSQIDDPFSDIMRDCMQTATAALARSVQTACFAYTQSDEISILLKDWDTLTTQAWFDSQVQKIVSIAAAKATMYFNRAYEQYEKIEASESVPVFDARVFNLPKEEVCNYFIWRQQDATRNSINMLAQFHFSHKELQGKNISQVQDMLMLQKGINWNDLETWKKRGTGVYKGESGEKNDGWRIDRYDTPIFTQDREYIDRFLVSE